VARVFYPPKLPQAQAQAQAQALRFASHQITAVKASGTFFGSQKPNTFLKWAAETPDGFVDLLKAPGFAVNASCSPKTPRGCRCAMFSNRAVPASTQPPVAESL
jgi:uncharacterized protein YecE (DUF72 family)